MSSIEIVRREQPFIVSRMILVNRECKEQYDELLSRIGDSFRKQIHGLLILP